MPKCWSGSVDDSNDEYRRNYGYKKNRNLYTDGMIFLFVPMFMSTHIYPFYTFREYQFTDNTT